MNYQFINIHIMPHHKGKRLCGLTLCVGTKQDVGNTHIMKVELR